jgi:MarR family transcriptional regulator, organic hydroperoxide resistance regulator
LFGGDTVDVSNFKNILWEYTRKISDNTSIAFNPFCEEYGLTMLQVRILVEVYHHEDHTIGSLANRINMAGTNISTMCKKLEKKGLMERIRDQADERVVRVAITAKGEEIVKEIDQKLNEKISQFVGDETEENLNNIIMGLQKLNELLQKLGNIEK